MRPKLSSISYLSILYYLATYFKEVNPLGDYGARCSYTGDCDISKKLFCVNGFCRCPSDSETYDGNRQQCAIREGDRCRPPEFLFGENNPCVSNAFCSGVTRSCQCASYSFADQRGQCLKKKWYNETCYDSGECDDLRYLSCVDGRCGCGSSSVYDEYYQICKRKVGDSCVKSEHCEKYAECVNSRCICKPGLSVTSGKTCALSYGETCEKNGIPCSDIYLACVNGVCLCKNPSYEVYENASGTCLSLAGGLCHFFMPTITDQPLKLKNCVPQAECVRRGLSPLSQCECPRGYVETVSGYCKLPYAAKCSTRNDADEAECIESLVCRDDRCQCQSQQDLYDKATDKCRKIVGTTCFQNDECVQNAVCLDSRCVCKESHVQNFRGECELSGIQRVPVIDISQNTIY